MHAVRLLPAVLIVLVALDYICDTATAQQQQTTTIITGPTVVQLPTIHTFSVSTTVLVPDRGSGYLGGVGGCSSGNFAGGAIGGGSAAAGAWIGAHIHDLREMDEQLLAEPGGGRFVATPPAAGSGATLIAPLESIAAIRAQAAAEDAARQQQALEYLARAREALARGQSGAAKVYFQMAATRSTGETRKQVLAELRAIAPANPPVAKSTVSPP